MRNQKTDSIEFMEIKSGIQQKNFNSEGQKIYSKDNRLAANLLLFKNGVAKEKRVQKVG